MGQASGLLVLQYLNDLKWLLECKEVIVADEPFSNFLKPDWRTRWSRLTQAPDSLVSHMSAAKSHFLGSYFEQLFSYAVQHFSELVVLAEHEQIQGEKATLGEVDLVAKDQHGRVLLFEVALKFYLERPDLAPNEWIGPNKNDSLHKKTAHARTHQLKILETREGASWLTSIAGVENYFENLVIFGRLFRKMSTLDETSFTKLHTGCGWLYLKDLPHWQEQIVRLKPAEKPSWITPSEQETQVFSSMQQVFPELEMLFETDSRPQLFSCEFNLGLDKKQPFWLFICPNSW